MAFMTMLVMRPAMLFRKFGLPQDTICLIMAGEKRGRVKRSSVFLRRNGTKAISTQTSIPVHVASAAPQMPKSSTPRKMNSSTALSALMSMFSHMLPRM